VDASTLVQRWIWGMERKGFRVSVRAALVMLRHYRKWAPVYALARAASRDTGR
jgi:hypothetical protein